MSQMADSVVAVSRKAEERLANRSTPFVFDCWYVAGFAWEFDRSLRARTLLGRPLVLFRSENGQPRALSDRCIHRSYPLSRSRLDGDTIVCGYHGLRYDARG
jgi:phenylpropionate dioxygenase-like ring-hydroxylating dioxygenase large terminal subunit